MTVQDPSALASPELLNATRTFQVGVGQVIRRIRKQRGWTQAVLARRADLSPNYVARLERGEVGPSLFVSYRICEALSLSLDIVTDRRADSAVDDQKSAHVKRIPAA